jgi:hypothetical protein
MSPAKVTELCKTRETAPAPPSSTPARADPHPVPPRQEQSRYWPGDLARVCPGSGLAAHAQPEHEGARPYPAGLPDAQPGAPGKA